MGSEVTDKLALIDRPQRFGILPSVDFWRRDGNYRLARPVSIPLALTIAGGLFALFLGLGFRAFWAFQFAMWIGGFLALGLVERHVRRRAREKRLLRKAAPSLAASDESGPADVVDSAATSAPGAVSRTKRR